MCPVNFLRDSFSTSPGILLSLTNSIVPYWNQAFTQMLAERSLTINIMVNSDIARNMGSLRYKLLHLGFSQRSRPGSAVCFDLRVGNPEIPKHVEAHEIAHYLASCRIRNPFVIEQCSYIQSLGKGIVWREYIAWLLNDRNA